MIKNKFIILEGPDNIGKSTQIKLLIEALVPTPTHVIHYSNIPGLTSDESKKYSTKLYDNMFRLARWASGVEKNNENANIICDRSHIGEAVYSPLYRGYNGDYVFKLEEEYIYTEWWKHIYLFVLIDSAENLINREDGKSFTAETQLKQKEIAGFLRGYTLSNIINKYSINVTNKTREDIHSEILKKLK